MAVSTNSEDVCAFSVMVKNEQRKPTKKVTHTREVDFDIFGERIRLKLDKEFEVNN